MELASRDVVSRAEQTEILEGRGFEGPYGSYIALDLRHLGEEKINERLPLIRDVAIKLGGVDPVKEPIPIRPAAHYSMGGIKANMRTETPIAGLYAAGECSCLSVHGANRLGTNSTAECLVFGAVAGEEAAKHALSTSFREIPHKKVSAEEKRIFDGILGSEGDERVPPLRDEIRHIMNEKVWISGEATNWKCLESHCARFRPKLDYNSLSLNRKLILTYFYNKSRFEVKGSCPCI